MLKRMSLLAVVAMAGWAVANTAGAAVPSLGFGTAPIVKVAEGCGEGFWRGPGGRCHPFARERRCPPGYHIGPEGQRCWPN